MIRDIEALLEEENDYYKPIRNDNFRNNNHIECESNSDRNRNLSAKKYFNETKSYLKDIIINLQKSDSWKIQLTIAINFISSKNNDEEQVMHLKSDNIEVMIYDTEN